MRALRTGSLLPGERIVAKKHKPRKPVEEVIILRPPRVKPTQEECLKRMEDFPKRRAAFVASIRKGKNRRVPG